MNSIRSRRINKKGIQMSLQMIVGITLLLLGFGAVLLFYNVLKPGDVIDKVACHASVIAKKATPALLKENTKFEFPLNCRTEKICFVTKKSENCENHGFTEEDYKAGIAKNEVVGSSQDVYKKIAGLLVEWWQTMGEGKGGMIWERDRRELGKKVHGVINARFAFSDGLKNAVDAEAGKKDEDRKFLFKEGGLGEYMGDYIYEDTGRNYWQLLSTQENNNLNFEFLPEKNGGVRGVIDANKQYAIVFFEQERGALAKSISQAGGFVLGSIAGAYAAKIAPGLITKLIVASGVSYMILEGVTGIQGGVEDWWLETEEKHFNAIVFIEYDSNKISNLGINSFEGLP